jgi:hypothetical protein
MKKTTLTHGGKRKGSGRKRRPTAVKKTVLIEQDSVRILEKLGNGYLGHGIDKAAQEIEKITAKGE